MCGVRQWCNLDGHAINSRQGNYKNTRHRNAKVILEKFNHAHFCSPFDSGDQIIPHPIKAPSHMHPNASNNFA